MVRRLTNVTGGVHVVALPHPPTLHDDLRVELSAALLAHCSLITPIHDQRCSTFSPYSQCSAPSCCPVQGEPSWGGLGGHSPRAGAGGGAQLHWAQQGARIHCT